MAVTPAIEVTDGGNQALEGVPGITEAGGEQERNPFSLGEAADGPMIGIQGFDTPPADPVETLEGGETPPGEVTPPAEGGETPQEGGETPPEGEEAGETPPETPVNPETLRIGDSDVPFADVLSSYERDQKMVKLYGAITEAGKDLDSFAVCGFNYVHMEKSFASGPEGAREVIGRMIAAAKEAYGGDIDFGDVSEESLAGLDPETMTSNEKALYTALKAAEKRADTAIEIARQAVNESKDALVDQKLNGEAEAHVQAIRKVHANAQVDVPKLLKTMKDKGLKDPVDAYRISHFGQAEATHTPKVEEEKKPPVKAPSGGGNSKTFDPADPNLTPDDIVAKLQAGYTPISK